MLTFSTPVADSCFLGALGDEVLPPSVSSIERAATLDDHYLTIPVLLTQTTSGGLLSILCITCLTNPLGLLQILQISFLLRTVTAHYLNLMSHTSHDSHMTVI